MKHIVMDEVPGSFEHVFAGDVHLGNADVSEHKIQRLIRLVLSKKNCTISFGGDQLEAISVTDKRFNMDEHGGTFSRIQAQRDMFIDTFKPLIGRIKWMLEGNHELVWWNTFQPTKDIAKALNCEYANGVMLKAIYPNFRLLDWHGAGFISSKAGDMKQRQNSELITLKRKLRCLPGDDCDAIISHHFHKILIHPPDRALEFITDPRTNKLVQHYTQPERIWIDKDKGLYRINDEDRWFCASGALLRSYIEGRMSYAEVRGYRPTELGVLVMKVRNDKITSIEPEYLE